MAVIQSSYDSKDDIPEGFEEAFEEKDGKAVFKGGVEVKSEKEYLVLHDAKKKAFDDYHELNNKHKSYEGIDLDAYKKDVEELETLRVRVKDGTDEETIGAIVKVRTERLTEDLTKKNKTLEEENNELKGFKVKTQKQKVLNEVLKKHVSEVTVADAQTIIGSSISRDADGKYTSNGSNGFEKGLEVEALVLKAIETRPHWKKQNVPGHGANGSGGAGGISEVQEFNKLLAKRTKGEKLSQTETKRINELASIIKAKQK